MNMTVGTKSILYGAHTFWIHPLFVAYAWWRLYGFPWDIRLWVAFCVHDLGYWGKPNMDGPEGEDHVRLGASIMHWLFDEIFGLVPSYRSGRNTWYQFCFYHSRYMAKRYNTEPSRLCYADKLAFVITWPWLYKLQVQLTGEWREYAAAHNHEVRHNSNTLVGWYYPSRAYVLDWVMEHWDGKKPDTWTRQKPGMSGTGPDSEHGIKQEETTL